ncbi:L,D-transpeptidase family protein [Deminuibacter soli]|uniref:L,D-TPase catalytic domain-containing protein n=1 Tax=Deminuibacter soli TaxID=2291815 RepID=A0A3E1NPW7_9BACT|nr:L,D-transpeptidase family protein [Deminuibacter soli]RFM29976.1 hypothetical protein DXN05_03105 [Deminuibacter soli]
MKNMILRIALPVLLLAGCHNKQKQPVADEKEQLLPRNLAITPQNAYSDLFLDSAAIEQFIAQQHVSDTIANGIRNFYNVRNLQFAWFASDGLTEQAYGFRSLYKVVTDSSAKKLDDRVDELMQSDTLSVSAGNASFVKTELLLTRRFVQFVHDQYNTSAASVVQQFIPLQKQDVLKMADSILQSKEKNDVAVNDTYSAVKKELEKYVAIAHKGGWNTIPAVPKKLVKGTHATVVTLIKKRLIATGELAGNDTSDVFSDTLVNAVKSFQQTHGHTPDGIVSNALLQEMNLPVLSRIQQLLINMHRMRWVPATPKDRLILVNIPEFKLHVWEGNKKAFDMNVVVGKDAHGTTMFSGNLNEIVFSPYWNLPPSIIRNEVLPSMEKNKHYLEEKHMEITGEQNGLPVIRQLPGEQNALGKVKFLFPNSFNIYFHDTNEKDLFKKDFRAYSHGCIRLEDPVKMAQYLLQDMPKWTPQRIDSAMNSGKEKFVELKKPVPVLISYYTAWMDENNTLQFRADIYGHDAKLAARMFTTPLAKDSTLAEK